MSIKTLQVEYTVGFLEKELCQLNLLLKLRDILTIYQRLHLLQVINHIGRVFINIR